MSKIALHHVRIYYEDTDHGGVVYHANYLRFMERARTEMLRDMGFELDALARDAGVIIAVKKAAVDFLFPARFNDYLRIESHILTLRGASFRCRQVISNGERALCQGEIDLVCLHAQRFRPVALPRVLVEAVRPYCLKDADA